MPKKLQHETLLGEQIEYPQPPPEVAAFLARAKLAAYDPLVSEDALISVIYGPENPVLEHGIFSGRGAVTPAVLKNPVYPIFLDLLDVKRAALGKTSKAALEAAFTETVSETAERLSLTTSAVRQAVEKGKIAAVKRPNGWLIDPRSADTYAETSKRRGPARSVPALKVTFGNETGTSFRVKIKDLEITGRESLPDGRITHGEVGSFKRAAFAISGEEMHRVFIIEPATKFATYEHGRFKIDGKFKFVAKVNDARKASTAFKEFSPE